jgi:hypothetical protein
MGLSVLLWEYDKPGKEERMSEVFIQVGSGLAIVLGLVHFASTKAALRDVTGLSADSYRMVVMQWVGLGYLLLFLGAVPLALVRFGAFIGTCADVIGISALAVTAVLAVTAFVGTWPTKNTTGKVVSFVFPIIAVFFALGTFM